MGDRSFDPEAETAFVARVLAREPDAMEKFTQRLARVPRFMANLNHRWGSSLDASELDDVTQDAQLAILRGLHGYRPIAPLEAWMFGVCHNHYRAAVRDKRRRVEQGSESLEEIAQAPPARGGGPEDWQAVEAALERIGGVEADVIRLKHLEDLTFVEIGERLSIASNTAKTRYYRGIARLRLRLGGANEGEADEGADV